MATRPIIKQLPPTLNMEDARKLSAFHDAELRRVSHDAALRTLELGFEAVDKQFVTIRLDGLAAFRVTDMRMQNVVSRLLVHRSNIQLSSSEVAERVNWIWTSCEGDQLGTQSTMTDFVRKVGSGELLLFVLEPSWGAELVAIVEGISVEG